MKPFDLEQAKAGAPVITRDGRNARILSFDLCNRYYPMVAAFTDSDGDEWVNVHTNEGKCLMDKDSPNDLFMAPVKREGWVNLYPPTMSSGVLARATSVYATKGQAEVNASPTRIACIRIEWEK